MQDGRGEGEVMAKMKEIKLRVTGRMGERANAGYKGADPDSWVPWGRAQRAGPEAYWMGTSEGSPLALCFIHSRHTF